MGLNSYPKTKTGEVTRMAPQRPEFLTGRPKVKVGVVQLASELYGKERNERKILRLIEAAAKERADLLVFPEDSSLGFPFGATKSILAKYRGLSETIPGPFTDRLGKAAARCGMHIVIGLPEADAGQAGRLYNSSVLFGPNGRTAVYRKVHLYTAPATGLDEKAYFEPGNEAMVVDTEAGRLGMMICYDICRPEYPRILTLAGAEILPLPAAWPTAGGPRWEALLRARAIENQLFVIGAPQGGKQFYGNGMVIDYQGKVLAHTTRDDSVEFCTIDLNGIRSWREMLPYLKDRKPALYREFSERQLLRDL